MATKKNQNKAYIFADLDVSNHVETKGWAKYLNWAFVNDMLHKHDDNASYSVKQYPVFDLKTRQVIPHMYQHYFLDPNTNNASVTVTVMFRGKSQTETLPCYQQIRHKGMVSVTNPDSMLVNKTAKRAEVKAAAELTGLGISLYMNGSTKGADKVSNNRHSSAATARRTQNRASSDRSSTEANRNSNLPSDKQVNFLKGLLKQAKSDGSKAYVYLYSNRDDLKNALDGPSASKAIKYLQRLIKYQKSHKVA